MTEFSFMPGQQQTPDALVGFSGGREAEAVSDLQSFLPNTPSLPPVSAPDQSQNWGDQFQQTPDFATSPLTVGQVRAFRGAHTGAQNLQTGLSRAGFGREVEEELAELEPGVFNTLVEPTFDLLSIGSYTVNGAADELLETGNLGAALRQGAIEFYNALPGVSHKEARRLTSADILLEHTDVFGTSASGRWAAMGLGLVMDVVLDPLTTPFLGLKVAQKGVGIARTGERLGGLALGLNTKPLINVGGQKLVDGIRNAGGSAGIVNVLARHQIPGAQKFGDWFLPDFEFKQAIQNAPTGEIRKEMQTAYDSFRQQRIGMVARYNEDTRYLGDVAAQIRDDLTQEENLFLGMWLDQSDEAFENAVTAAAQKFSQRPDTPFQFSRDRILEKARLFRREYRKMAERETDDFLGLWKESDIRDFYNPGRSPTTPYSARFWRNTRDESSADQLSREQIDILEAMGWKNPVDPSQPRTAVGGLQGTEKMAAAQAKSYQTVQERWVAGEPTELHASLNFIQRGQESIRAISARGLLHSVAADPTISRRIKNPAKEVIDPLRDVSIDDIASPQKMRELHRQGYAVVDLASIRPLSTVTIAGESLTGTKAIDDVLDLDIDSIRRLGSEKDNALHIMPIPVVKDLMKGTKSLSDETLIGDLAEKFMKFSGVWKAYALFSPGYHMRNMYSNWYQNWMAGITDDKLYMKSLALQNGGTENLPFGVRQIVERRIGKMSMGQGSRWAEGDDVWFEAAGTKLNGNQVQKLLDDHLVNDTGLFARDMFIDTEKQLLRQKEKNITQSLYTIPTKVHDEIMDELDGTVYTVDEREFIANLAENRVKTRALSDSISMEEAWERERWRVTPHDDLDAQNVDGAWLLQDGEKIHMDIVGGPYGERVEKAIDGAFYDNPMPTYDQLRGIPGLESIRKRDMSIFVDQFRSARDKATGDNSWWKKYGKEVQSRIGEANMPEFSMVFSIAKGNPAERLKETFGVMRMAREGGTSVAGLPEQYKTLYKQGMTDLEKLASQRSNFFGFTPRDENIPRFFSDKFNVANEDSYRSVSHLVRKMAQMDNMSLEDAEAVVWNIVNRKKDDINAPGIDWISAWEHAKEEVNSFFALDDALRTMPGFQVRRLMPRAHGTNAPKSAASLGLLNEAKFISSLGFKSTGDSGAFGVSGHSLDSSQQIEFGKSLLDEVTDPDGQQITALKELDEMFGVRHYIRTHPALINGSPEPTFHLVVEGGDERLSKFYGTILADAFDQDQVRFITPTPTGGTGDALLLRRESGAWSDEQIRDMMEQSLDNLDVNPDRQFITLANHDNDPQWLSRVSKMIAGDADIIPEHFRFQGEVIDNDDFGRILAETRGAVTHKGGPDILKRITRDLHESYVQAYERIGNKYGLRPLRGKDDVLRGSSRGLRGADEVAVRSKDLRASGHLLEQRDLGPVGQKLLDNFDLADVDDEIGFILPDGRKIKYDEDLTHSGMISKALGEKRGTRSMSALDESESQMKESLGEGLVRVAGPGDYHLSGTPTPQQMREMARYASDSGRPEYTSGAIIIDVDNSLMGGVRDSQTFRSVAEMQRFFALKQTTKGKKKPRGIVKGAIDLADEANAIIHLTQYADVSTMIHELGHYWRRGLNTKDSKVIEDWIGSAFKNWNVPNEETFARGFEKYMREGVAPTEELGDLFDQAKVYMEFIYATLRGSPLSDRAMPQEVKDVFGRMLGDGALGLDEPTIKVLNTRPKIRNATDAMQAVGDWLDRNVGVDSAHIKASRGLGQSVENNSRITHFIGVLQKVMGEGLDLDRGAIMAKDSVDKYLFDYNLGLTDFERNVVRPLIPFYSWMRFNIPLQIQAVFENPARYSKVPKFINNMEAMTRDWQGIEAPDYFRELQAVRLPAIMNSKPVYINPNLPFQDLNRTMLTGFPDVLANLTPFIRVAGELVPEKGYSTFLESPIEKYTGERSKDLHLPFMPSTTLGVGKKWENAINSLFPPLGKITRFNKAQRREEASAFLASEILGIKLMNVDTQRTIRGETYAKRKALTDLKKRLEDEHNIHIDTRQRKTRRGRQRKKKDRPRWGDTF